MKKLNKPPKFAISNGFAIGHLPEDVSRNITPLVNNLVAPVRAFNYFVSFNCGKELKNKGEFYIFCSRCVSEYGSTTIHSNGEQ